MKANHMIKKISILFVVLLLMNAFNIFTYGTSHSEIENDVVIELAPEDGDKNLEDKEKTEDENKNNLNDASNNVVNSNSRKDKRIAELTDKYNDSLYGHVAYYLEVVQKYSLPVCFIGITIGAFNFLIIGNKMLDKKEQGFGWIVGFTIGLVVFNVLPLIFALFVAGR